MRQGRRPKSSVRTSSVETGSVVAGSAVWRCSRREFNFSLSMSKTEESRSRSKVSRRTSAFNVCTSSRWARCTLLSSCCNSRNCSRSSFSVARLLASLSRARATRSFRMVTSSRSRCKSMFCTSSCPCRPSARSLSRFEYCGSDNVFSQASEGNSDVGGRQWTHTREATKCGTTRGACMIAS